MNSAIMDRFDSMDRTYIKKLFFKLAMVFLIIGGLNWLLVGVFEYDLVQSIFGNGLMATLVYVLVGISALAIMFDRDTYLPFLGPMVAPCSVLQDHYPSGATKHVKIIITPHTKVLYWAAEPANDPLEKLQTWKGAYLNYDNAGVTTSNADGVAILKIRDPQSYKVPFKGRLEPHVHYRVCGEAGWMGRIHTIFVPPNGPEGFENQKTDKNYRIMNLADSSASIY
jgi:uncharacterized membrane protein YuzA (DUF378 family)